MKHTYHLAQDQAPLRRMARLKGMPRGQVEAPGINSVGAQAVRGSHNRAGARGVRVGSILSRRDLGFFRQIS